MVLSPRRRPHNCPFIYLVIPPCFHRSIDSYNTKYSLLKWLLLSWLPHKWKREFSNANFKIGNLADVSTECFN